MADVPEDRKPLSVRVPGEGVILPNGFFISERLDEAIQSFADALVERRCPACHPDA